ncbi:adenylate/guanylate cyclase domain-containing protein [Terrabacter sp. Root181]|uniref:adenylate/guanylate cyclase domain-containing protein n=1 Tax=Terrabacter sp. Root181 TaxID=1736484 RepID=UPI0007022766|nr:adenylate/guanylate cyclase domain-containing protein [Terrabacter sp. Root181]KRB44277.1 hypothetical protein ASD90_17955 [Terrabacter sp. Root181]
MTTSTDNALDLAALLTQVDDATAAELASKPEVDTNWTGDLDVAKLPIVVRKWVEVPDVVAVVADMKNSTKMGTGKHAASTASIYQASTGGVVTILNKFEADFIQIQGDGAFALYWGERRYQRALCAAVTVQSFGGKMAKRLEEKWPDAPETGLKVGVASSRILVKRIGTPRNPAEQEPVWAGKAVNYAAKAAQGAERHQLIVTGSVWDAIEGIDYLTTTCGCPGGKYVQLWTDVLIDRLPEGDPDAQGRMLGASWCDQHGDEFCNAILAGKKTRPEVADQRAKALASQRQTVLRTAAQKQRLERLAHRRGLAR